MHDFKSRIKYILEITNSPQFTFRYYSINYDVNVSTSSVVKIEFFFTSVIVTFLPSFHSNDFITNLMPASWIYKQALLKSTAVYALVWISEQSLFYSQDHSFPARSIYTDFSTNQYKCEHLCSVTVRLLCYYHVR